MEELRNLCTRVSESFTSEWNTVLAQLAPELEPSPDAFAEHGDVLVFNYPGELMSEERAGHLPPHVFIGSSVRAEAAEDHVQAWISESDEPFVYVSFGSFLSVRGDVLNKVVTALKESDIRAAVAYGSAGAESLGDVPENWLVGEFLPQVTLLGSAAAAVTHGGNNSVTESLTFGVPTVVLPFSTDQFAGAAALEDIGFGAALAPNTATVQELRLALGAMLSLPQDTRDELHSLGQTLREGAGRSQLRAALAKATTGK